MHQLPLPPENIPSNHLCDQKDYVNEKLQWYNWESNRELPVCSKVPQPTAHCVPLPKVQRTFKDTCIHTKWEGMGDIFIEHVLITESHYKHTLLNDIRHAVLRGAGMACAKTGLSPAAG
jgi:hypothetical protein